MTAWARRLVCRLVGCLAARLQWGQGLAVCRDCGRRWRTWRKY
jgi:hypothetical protein